MVKGQAWALGRTRVRLSNKPQELSAGGKRASNTQAALTEMWWAKRHNAYTGGGWDAPFFLNFSFPTPLWNGQCFFNLCRFCCIGKGCFEDTIRK